MRIRLSVIEFDVGALFKVRQSPDVSLGTKGTSHAVPPHDPRNNLGPRYPFERKPFESTIALELADSRRTRSCVQRAERRGVARSIRVQSNSNNYQSRLVYLLGAKTGSFYEAVERGVRSRFVPSIVAAATVNPNCIIKI